MRRETLSPETALGLAAAPSFPWAMIQTFSHLTLGRNPLLYPEDCPADLLPLLHNADRLSQTLLEARFFSREAEIRVFRGEGGLTAVLLAEEAEDRYLEETTEIANAKQFGNSVTVRRLIGFDCDGQAYITAERLCGWEAADNG